MVVPLRRAHHSFFVMASNQPIQKGETIMKKPNIIVFLTDDQGYGDLSCMGSTDVCTPNLDILAAGGARFTDFYAGSAVCSPSRACLLTGRYPYMTGVRSILGGIKTTTGLNPGIPTFASALKDLGYATGMVGKWHLGAVPECRPTHMGFDYFCGFLSGVNDYFSHIHYTEANSHPGINPNHDLWENDERCLKYTGEYSTELFARKGLEFIREQVEKDMPFALYCAFNAPHYPMHAPYKYLERFKHLPEDRQIMAAMLSAVDDGVGEIMNYLKRRGIFNDTIIYFQSDNGPSKESRNWLDERKDYYYGGSTGGLKGHKFSLFDGGIRVPAIFSWPAMVPAGQVISEPCMGTDIFPTFINAAGGNASDYEISGCDILPVMTIGARRDKDCLYWEMGQQTAVRRGNYKLVINGFLRDGWSLPLDPKTETKHEVWLSDLSQDMGEEHNLVEEMPELAKELEEKALTWRRDLEAYWTDAPKADGQLDPNGCCAVMQATYDYE